VLDSFGFTIALNAAFVRPIGFASSALSEVLSVGAMRGVDINIGYSPSSGI
jgi:hypothetical protein